MRQDVVAAAVATYNGPQALILATQTGLTISRVNSLKKLSMQTYETGELSATRLAYCPVHKMLAAGVIQRHMSRETGDVEQRASLELRDPVTMQGAYIMSFPQQNVMHFRTHD
jgi:DNA damage-binding protein 1